MNKTFWPSPRSPPAPSQGRSQHSRINAEDQVLLSQIQADKPAVVLKSLELTDPESRAFTPIYDEYQDERKEIAERRSPSSTSSRPTTTR